MAELLKETKIKRRNAKAALTRAGKSLRHLIESKRPGKEVRDVLSKVQAAHDKLIENHEEFTKLIEDDKEFEKQEAWLEESQYMFLSLETISFPEAVILLVRRRGSRPLARSNTGSPRFTDFPSLCVCSESSLANLIGSGVNLL